MSDLLLLYFPQGLILLLELLVPFCQLLLQRAPARLQFPDLGLQTCLMGSVSSQVFLSQVQLLL